MTVPGVQSTSQLRQVLVRVALLAFAVNCLQCSRPDNRGDTQVPGPIPQDWVIDNSVGVPFRIASNRAHFDLSLQAFSEEPPREIELYLENPYFSEAHLTEIFSALSARFPSPRKLLIFTYTDLATLKRYQGAPPSPAPPRFESDSQAREWVATDATQRRGSYAFYYRWENGLEGFKYTMDFSRPIETTVTLKEPSTLRQR